MRIRNVTRNRIMLEMTMQMDGSEPKAAALVMIGSYLSDSHMMSVRFNNGILNVIDRRELYETNT